MQAQSWQELQNECEQYIDAGQFDAALKQAEKMYSYADRKYDKLSEEYIYSLRTIAKIYNLSRNSKKAVEYYHEAYSLILARIKKNVPGMGMSLDYTKDYFSYVTDPVANAQFYEKACDRMMKVDTVDYTVLTDITKYYTDAIAQTYGTASPEQKDLSPEEGSIDDELYLAYYDSVIKAGMQYGKYEQALKNIALIRKFREDKQDTESIEYASHFFNSGYMLYLKQRYDQSYEEYQKGFELWEKGQFAINELYGTSIYFYGALYMIKQDWSSVLELFEAHVDEIEKALGKDFIFYESVLSSLASAYKVKGEYDKAEEFYER
ncbi:MAG: hypothetical protein C0594_13180 [Marinilabiliales bacterium]|nr:MAG: hypothetical protein C0594_13180 [Marinilabiliales bacterium]